jgi:hypothetical protein
MNKENYNYSHQVGDLVEILPFAKYQYRIGLVVGFDTNIPENHILHTYQLLMDDSVLSLFNYREFKKAY